MCTYVYSPLCYIYVPGLESVGLHGVTGSHLEAATTLIIIHIQAKAWVLKMREGPPTGVCKIIAHRATVP